MSVALRPTTNSSILKSESLAVDEGENGGGCCRGIENLELWGAAVKWGTDFKFNSSEECCQACKKLCSGNDGPCLCDSWVFCGNREACGPKFGEVSYNSSTFFGPIEFYGFDILVYDYNGALNWVCYDGNCFFGLCNHLIQKLISSWLYMCWYSHR